MLTLILGSLRMTRTDVLIFSIKFFIDDSSSLAKTPNCGLGIFPAGPKTLPKVVATAGINFALEIKLSYFFNNFLISFLSLYLAKSSFLITSINFESFSKNAAIFLSLNFFGNVIKMLNEFLRASISLRFIIKSTLWSKFLFFSLL